MEHGLGHLPFTEKQVVTPTGVLGHVLLNSVGCSPMYSLYGFSSCSIVS